MFKWIHLLGVLEFTVFVLHILKLEHGSNGCRAVITGRTARSIMSQSDITSLQSVGEPPEVLGVVTAITLTCRVIFGQTH